MTLKRKMLLTLGILIISPSLVLGFGPQALTRRDQAAIEREQLLRRREENKARQERVDNELKEAERTAKKRNPRRDRFQQ